MKKVILVDGNNLMFRSYYATLYSGALMKNSKGFVTNALYGFTTMINKIVVEENPVYMAVAFDIGKSFRHKEYEDYKKGRNETPDDLIKQMPIARDILDGMGIKYYEVENYEADDIIGTIAKMAEVDPTFDATIVSSDKDFLQLISDEVDVKLLKQKGHVLMNTETFVEEYGIEPIRMIDLKALAGDVSDNVPGVKGVGEKTALKLLKEYETLENIYDNIDNIKGALKNKLIDDKDNAFFSKELCTIYIDVPLKDKLEEMTYEGPNEKLDTLFDELEFYSLKKRLTSSKPAITNDYKILKDIKELKESKLISYYIEASSNNYHTASILGMGLYDGKNTYFVKENMISDVMNFYKDSIKYTYDLKKNIVLLKDYETNTTFDLMLALYLLNYPAKDDIATIMNNEDIQVSFYEDILKDEELLVEAVTLKSKYIHETKEDIIDKLKLDDMLELYSDTEMPLITVLARMESTGIKVDADVLKEMNLEVRAKLDSISNKIYNLAGKEFNIGSPKQLGEILFDHLGLTPKGKTATKNYKTDAATLEKLVGDHDIIPLILEHRNLSKLASTYLEGLNNYIMEDNKIHTIYKQTLTRTGRLSSVEPNLQNIPVRDDIGRKVRKAFIPTNDLLMACDYSQIELRILAHISESEELIATFNKGDDIHTKVASDIFDIPEASVDENMRRTAKAVIFGIVYGISGFGLGENLNLPPHEAKKLIDKYLELYPGVKTYMDNIIKEAKENGSVRTLFKRKRVIDEISSKNYILRSAGERIALNTPIQGSNADIIKMAMVKIDKAMIDKSFKSKMILQVHDELIFDVVKEEKEKLEKLVIDVMENIVTLKVPIKVGVSYGTNWYEA